jgi:hypothetical protein
MSIGCTGTVGAALSRGSWYAFLLPVLGIGLISHWGIFGRIDSWQLATFGSENIILLAVLFSPLMFIPRLVTAILLIDQSTPFLLGMRQASDADWGPKVEWRTVAASRLRAIQRACLIVAGIGLASLIFAVSRGVYDAGLPRPPLPRMSLARLADPSVPLPAAARIVGAAPDLSKRWNYDFRVRQDLRHDVYYALRAPGASAETPAAVVEVDQTSPQNDVKPSNMVDAPGSREGTLSILGDWEAGEIRRAGVRLAPHVTLLTREQLDGKTPDPQETPNVLFGIFGFVGLIMGIALWWSFGRAARLAEARVSGDFTKV